MTTVLLVEDDPATRQGLEMALRRLGHGVHPAGAGEAALRAIGEADVDVVVLDVMLPGLDGFEVCRRLRRDSDVPVNRLPPVGDPPLQPALDHDNIRGADYFDFPPEAEPPVIQ